MTKRKKKTGRALGGVPATNQKKTKVIEIATKTGVDLLVGGLIGGAIGAAVGKWSILGGAAIGTLGHAIKQPLVCALGVGLMASGVNDVSPSVSGTDDVFGLEGAKDRLIAYGQGLKQKLFIDKLLPAPKPVSGLGEVQYFTYPSDNPVGALDTSVLDRIESQVNANAEQFAASRQVSGLGDVFGLEGSLADPLY